jgi:transcriptional regulator of acetoin/glycerol metabolism
LASVYVLFLRVSRLYPEKAHILVALPEHRWNQTKVAAELGISRTTLWRKMKRYDIGIPS